MELKISSLKEAICKNKKQEIENIENEIAKNINEYCLNKDFYTLSTDVIKEIINKTNINEIRDINTICNILENSSNYENNAPLLLSCFNPPKITLDECIKIISSLKKVPICLKLEKLSVQTREHCDERDWDYELNKKEQKIRELEDKLIEYETPDDFEGDIFKAVENNNLKDTQMQYQ